MNITLIDYKYAVPLDDPCCYPLGFMYISAQAKKLGHNVKVLNYNLWDYDLVNELRDQDVAMFTGFEEFYSKIKEDVAVCKLLGVKTIVGGALATFIPEQMLKICDTVVIGEGDVVIEAALRKSGIVFGLESDWWKVLPDYDGFGINEYHKRHMGSYMGVLTSRGCPYNCTFCAHTCKYSVRPIVSVLDEIESYVDQYGISMIVFNDNTLNASASRFEELIGAMESRNVMWSASIRLDLLTDHIVRAMKQSGCKYLVVGVESFQQSKLDMMNKHITVAEIMNGLNLLHKHGIGYHGNVMVGFEGETMEDVRREISLIPAGYEIYPTLVRPFMGIKETCKSKLTKEDKEFLDTTFREYIMSKGKYLYPDLPEVATC